MKKIFLFFSAVLISFMIGIYYHNSSPGLIIGKFALDSLEKAGDLKYKINFLNVLPMGEATLFAAKTEEYHGSAVYHLSANAKTSGLVAKFFSAKAMLDSYVDKQDNNPLYFKQKLQISGKPDTEKEVLYDQKSHIMSVAGVRRSILPDTQDPLSAMLHLSKMDFDQISDFEMNINTNQKNYSLKGTVKPQVISSKGRKFKAYLLKAEIKRRDKNNPYHRSRITMVVLKADRNIPILIKVFASGALINARLIENK